MSWVVTLTGNERILEQLSKVLGKDEFSIQKNEEKYILHSRDFLDMKSSEDVKMRALELVQSINGAIAYATRLPLAVEVADVIYTGANRKDVRIGVENSLTICYDIESTPDWPHIGDLAKLAAKFPEVAEVLGLFTKISLDYFDYYKVYEIVRDDCKNELITRGYIQDKQVLDKLTCNLNHPKLSGGKARHARMDGCPDKFKKALTEGEIYMIIRTMIAKWLKDKMLRCR